MKKHSLITLIALNGGISSERNYTFNPRVIDKAIVEAISAFTKVIKKEVKKNVRNK